MEITPSPLRVIDAAGLDQLIALLIEAGYGVIGPQMRDGAIVYDVVNAISDLPRGILDQQDGGHYRTYREGDAYFGYVVGPSTWKRYLHKPRQVLDHVEMSEGAASIRAEPVDESPQAFLAVRPCELAAIEVQDRVFMDGPYRDPHYTARRKAAFIIAVNCGRAAETCFCTSMDTGPKARRGFDVALTEIATGQDAAFLAEAGSDEGRMVLDRLDWRHATDDDCAAAARATRRAEAQIRRRIDTDGLADLLKSRHDHPRWDDVAGRCLSCANCTMVCPTCFCTTVEEMSDIDATRTLRVQRWDSCFTADFSYIHGAVVRSSPLSRYRQWMTHKLATWHDQFGTSGCIGCGRCITWCPVGIDITEEAAAIRGS